MQYGILPNILSLPSFLLGVYVINVLLSIISLEQSKVLYLNITELYNIFKVWSNSKSRL